MTDQLQFVAFDFLHFHSQTSKDEIFDIPELSDLNSNSSQCSSMEPEESTEKQIFIQDSTSTQFSQKQQKMIKNSSKSVLHNMQKHFFTFIQYLTPKTTFFIENLHEIQVEVLKCSKELVKLIKIQKRKTKQELVPIFGEFDEKKIYKSNSIYGGLAQKYSIEILKGSLCQLKEYYLSAIKSQNVIEEYLKSSKMERKTEFKKYIESFIVEVETKKFKFRLTKESQESMKNQLKKEEKRPEEWENFFSLN